MTLTRVSYSMIAGAPINVLDYGAVNSESVDNSGAIQAAIDYATSLGVPAQVLIPSGCIFGLNVGARTGIAAGVAGIVLKDNVTLIIDGTLKALPGIYGPGTLSALIKTPDVGITNAGICGTGVVDGNRDNQLASVQCDNIYLRAVYNVKVEGIYSVNANGNGILINCAVGASGHTDTAVINTTVAGCNTIGIQVSHATTNLIISGNQVTSCANNCIDVYNENGTTSPDTGSISIIGNTVSGGLAGIFPETTANCSVIGNSISGCSVGVQTNRINGAPNNIVTSGNNIHGCATGIVGSGDTNGILICNNTISGFTSEGVLLTGITVASYTVQGNTFAPATTTTPIIRFDGTTLAYNQILSNVCNDPSHNSAYGIVITAGSVVASTLQPIIYSSSHYPVKNVGNGLTTSGGTTSLTFPANTAGKLVIQSSAGGAYETVWSGSFVSNSTRVSVAQESTTFTTPGNGISSVAGSTSTLVGTITWAATGSAGIYQFWIEYI